MDTYRKLIWELDSEYEISAVGIGAGGRIDEESGTVLYAVDIYKDYIGLQIGKILENEFAVPVEVTNDCRAAVIGEHWMGAARGAKDVFGIILGTGVGRWLLYGRTYDTRISWRERGNWTYDSAPGRKKMPVWAERLRRTVCFRNGLVESVSG